MVFRVQVDLGDPSGARTERYRERCQIRVHTVRDHFTHFNFHGLPPIYKLK